MLKFYESLITLEEDQVSHVQQKEEGFEMMEDVMVAFFVKEAELYS